MVISKDSNWAKDYAERKIICAVCGEPFTTQECGGRHWLKHGDEVHE